MGIDWNGELISLVDATATSYESRVHRQIAFGGLILIVAVIVWRLMR